MLLKYMSRTYNRNWSMVHSNDLGLYYLYQPWKKTQRIQSLAVRKRTGNFDYIHSRGVDIVRPLHLQTVKERRDYFLCVLMFKCIHGIAPKYLCNDVTMYVDIHGYDTRSGKTMDLSVSRVIKDIYREFLVIWLPIYGISYLPMLRNQQLLTHLNKIISIRKVG